MIPTLVVASDNGRCVSHNHERDHKGIVFYNSDPVAWCCLSDDEVVEFKTWAATAFPSVQIVTVSDPQVIINCPPDPTLAGADPDADAAILAQIRARLAERAVQWFVPAIPTGVTCLDS